MSPSPARLLRLTPSPKPAVKIIRVKDSDMRDESFSWRVSITCKRDVPLRADEETEVMVLTVKKK